MSIMANYWARRGKDVTIVTIDSKESDSYFLHPRVKRIALALMKPSLRPWEPFQNNFYRVKCLRREIKALDADVVISFVDKTNVLVLLATFGLGPRVVVSERIDPLRHRIGWTWQGLRRLLYIRASAVVVQSHRVVGWAQTFLPRGLVYSIPNPVEVAPPGKKKDHYALPAGRSIVAMGRLTRQKGYDLLLRAFAVCAPKHPEWCLVIFGEGEERHQLGTLAKQLGIANRVILPGLAENPTVVLRKADLFVLSSRFEGFPNALLEAMACGLPVVSFDCPCGPREIIRNGEDGVLVPSGNLASLAAAMDSLMANENERKRLSIRAKDVTKRFGLEKVMGMWEDLLSGIL